MSDKNHAYILLHFVIYFLQDSMQKYNNETAHLAKEYNMYVHLYKLMQFYFW